MDPDSNLKVSIKIRNYHFIIMAQTIKYIYMVEIFINKSLYARIFDINISVQ